MPIIFSFSQKFNKSASLALGTDFILGINKILVFFTMTLKTDLTFNCAAF